MCLAILEEYSKYICKNLNCEIKNRQGRLIYKELHDLAIKLYKEGKTQVEIAKIVSRDKSTVCKWIKDFKSKQEPQ